MTAGHAKANLWRALQDGALTATGRRNNEIRESIAATLWQDLELTQDGLEGPETIQEVGTRNRWSRVTVRRDDVLRIWPATANAPARIEPAVKPEPSPYDHLPLASWLPLEIVLYFVQDGWALHPSNMTMAEAQVPLGPDGSKRRKGALLAHQPADTSDYDDPAIDRFNRLLTNAGLEGRVRFRGVPVGEAATKLQDIPSDYFTATRMFGPIPFPIRRLAGLRAVAVGNRTGGASQ